MRAIAVTMAGLAILAGAVHAEDDEPTEPEPTATSVIAKMMQANASRNAQLQNYTSIRNYSLLNSRFKIKAQMKVRITYTAPGPLHYEVIEESGPAAVRGSVFRRMLDSETSAKRRETGITPDNYSFTLMGMETPPAGHRLFVLSAEPRTSHPLLFRGKIWLDAEDYAITRIEGAPAQNPSFWLKTTRIVHSFNRVGDGYWMAASNASQSDVRVFGRTEVRIEYLDYKINAPE